MDITELKKGDIVTTPDGKGIVQYTEYYKNYNKHNKRVCVKLDNNTDIVKTVVFYWESELS